LMMAMHLCGVTRNIKIGCGFNIVPMWHPLRLAEDYAMADILTGGRVIFGVGRGYHTREVETFGNPLIDQNANREMFEEGVAVLFKAFEGKPFSHQGKYYTIPPEVPYRGYTLKEITLVPAPERLPVECVRDPAAIREVERRHGRAAAEPCRPAQPCAQGSCPPVLGPDHALANGRAGLRRALAARRGGDAGPGRRHGRPDHGLTRPDEAAPPGRAPAVAIRTPIASD